MIVEEILKEIAAFLAFFILIIVVVLWLVYSFFGGWFGIFLTGAGLIIGFLLGIAFFDFVESLKRRYNKI